MRKMLIAIVIVLALTACVSAQDTAAPIGLTFYANAGLTLPVSPEYLSNWWDSGSNFGGGIGYDLSPYITMQGFFTANSFAFKTSKYEELFATYLPWYTNVSSSGGTIKITTVTANVKASFIAHGNRVIPYFVGGLGYFHISGEDVTTSYIIGTTPGSVTEKVFEESKSTLSSCLGFGVDVKVLEQAGIFIEFTSTAGAVEIKNRGGLPDADEGIVGYAPFRFGAFYQL